LQVFESQTAPVLDYYQDHGIVQQIDGMLSPDQVFEQICQCVEPAK
jgi:adenylate kinase